MSATFFLKLREQYVRLTFIEGKSVYELVDRSGATPFISEADAWLAAHQHRLNIQWCDVVSASDPEKNFARGNGVFTPKAAGAITTVLLLALCAGCCSWEPEQSRKYRELRRQAAGGQSRTTFVEVAR